MKRAIVFTYIGLALAMMSFAQDTPQLNEAYLQYIAKYRKLAEEQEKLHKIPACITLAQGLLESGAGNSELAVKAKNHFGIKCHKDWEGATYTHDDETRDECFRKYNKVADSYEDHSKFLLRPRYASLFELPITDYKGWAHGLRRCGYATDPTYAAKLIHLIEDYGLAPQEEAQPAPDEATDLTSPAVTAPVLGEESKQLEIEQKLAKKEEEKRLKEEEKAKKAEEKRHREEQRQKEQEKRKQEREAEKVDSDQPEQAETQQADLVAKSLTKGPKVNGSMGTVSLFAQHKVFSDKAVRWVVAEKGDSYEEIGYEFNIEPERMLRYNHATKGQKPEPGQKVYLTRHK